jgi:PST family polysaccharide transporter
VRRKPPVDGSKALGKTAQKGVVWSFVRESVSEILVFPASMVIARLLTPREFGIAAASVFFIQLAGRLGEMGFNSALIRAKEVKPIHLQTVFLVQIGIGLTLCATMIALSPWIAHFYNMPEATHVLPIAALGFVIAPWGSVSSTILQRNLEYKKNTTIDWVQLVVTSVTNVGLALLGFSYMSIIYARLSSNAATQAMRLYFTGWRPTFQFSKAALMEILPSGTGFFAKRLLDYSAENGDNLIVGKVLGLTSLGLYDKAYSTMDRFLTRLNTGGPGVMFRVFAVIHEEPERFRRAYTKVMLSSSLLGFPVFTALAVMAPQTMAIMFGPQWGGAAAPFALLCGAGALKLLNTYVSAATQAAGRVWSEVWRQILFVAMIVGFIIVFKDWGPTGAAFGVLCATAIMTVLMHVLLQRITHLPWGRIFRPLMPAVACSLGLVGVLLGLEYAIRAVVPHANAWLLAAVQVPLGSLFVAAFVLFAPFRDMRDVIVEVTDTLAPKAVKQHRWMQAYLRAAAPAGNAGAA